MDSDCEITRALLLVARRCIPVTSSNALVTSCYYIVVTYYCSCFSKVPFATAQAGRGSRCRRPRGPGGRWELSWRPYGRDAGGQRPGPKGKEDRRRTEGGPKDRSGGCWKGPHKLMLHYFPQSVQHAACSRMQTSSVALLAAFQVGARETLG